MAVQNIKKCVNNLNQSDCFSNNIEKTFWGRFKFFASLLSVSKYEEIFYKTQGEYTRCLLNSVSKPLRNKIREITLLKKNRTFIDCWDINPFESEKYIVMFSGIGTEKSDFMWQMAYEKFVEKGFGVIAFDYSGRGQSGGEFCQKNAVDDAYTVYNYLLNKNIKPYNIGVLGHSMGAAVALAFSSKIQTSYVILLNPFNKASDMMKVITKQLYLPEIIKNTVNGLPDFLLPLKNRFNNEKLLSKIEAPTLILHDIEDDTIPIRLSRRLYFRNKHKKNISYLELDGSNHEIYSDKISICLNFIENSDIWFFNNL